MLLLHCGIRKKFGICRKNFAQRRSIPFLNMKPAFLTFVAVCAWSLSALQAQDFSWASKKTPASELPRLADIIPNWGFSKLSKVPDRVPSYLAPYSKFDLVQDCNKKEKVVEKNTIELCRKAFTKWEEHCCGIKIKGNYMKVTYQTFYSDGSSVIWDKEYRS